MRTTAIALLLGSVGAIALAASSPEEPSSTELRASQYCVVTEDTYVLGRKVLGAGEYCIPWL
jgi:hypothetical protein